MYKLRLMPQPLTLVKIMDRVLYRADGVTQIPIVSATISGVDSGWFGDDEVLSLKVFDVLGNRVPAHANCPTDGAVAWVALVGLPVLAVHQVGINGDLPEGQSERKDFIRQRKVIFDGVALVVMSVTHWVLLQ